jgi:hypothetical protein
VSADALRRKVSEALDGAGGLDAPAHTGLRAELAADEDAAEWARDAVRLDGLLRGWPEPERGEDFWDALGARIDERVAGDKGAAGPDVTSPPFVDDADVRAARLATQAGKGVEGLRALDAKRAAFSLDLLSDLGGAAPPPAPAQAPLLAKSAAVAKPATPVAAPVVARASVATVVAQPETLAASPVSAAPAERVEVAESNVNRPAAVVSNTETLDAAVDVDVSVDDAPAADAPAPMVEAGLPRTAPRDVASVPVSEAAPRPLVSSVEPVRREPRPLAPARDDRVSLPSFRPPIAPLRPLEPEVAPASSRRGWVVGAMAALAAALVGVAVFVMGRSEQDAPAPASAVATAAPMPVVAVAPTSEVAAAPSAGGPPSPPPAAAVPAAPEPAPTGLTGAARVEASGGAAAATRPSQARGAARRVRGDADELGERPAGGGSAPSRAASPAAAGAPAPRPAPAAAPEPDEPLPETPDRADVLSAMGSVRDAVATCAAGRGGVVTVRATFAGSSGRVTTAVIEGAFAGTAEGSCMARAIRAARVPRFAQPTASVSFPFQL